MSTMLLLCSALKPFETLALEALETVCRVFLSFALLPNQRETERGRSGSDDLTTFASGSPAKWTGLHSGHSVAELKVC